MIHVAVIGAGIAGAASAVALLEAGCRVTIIEPDAPGGEQAASYGNGAWLNPASILPMSMPGLWKKIPGYLTDPTGPLVLRAGAVPALTPWLIRFLAAGWTEAKVTRTALALRALLRDAPLHHAALAGAAGVPHLVRRDGLLYAYPDRAAFEADAFGWGLRRDNGIAWQEFEGEAVQILEPALAARYRFAALVEEGGHCRDPGGYVAALVSHAVALGATLVPERATAFETADDRLCAVMTERGRIPCDRAVIAAGIASRWLAAEAGDTVPMTSERGYHVMIDAPQAEPKIPVMPSDGKMAVSALDTGLRISGQVELARIAAEPDWRRSDILLAFARTMLPGLPATGDIPHRRWMGHRPSTSDGLPVIGRARMPGVIHAFGHGHVGLAAGAMTGRLIAELALERAPSIDMAPFSAKRFR